jgi:hypothetical protein
MQKEKTKLKKCNDIFKEMRNYSKIILLEMRDIKLFKGLCVYPVNRNFTSFIFRFDNSSSEIKISGKEVLTTYFTYFSAYFLSNSLSTRFEQPCFLSEEIALGFLISCEESLHNVCGSVFSLPLLTDLFRISFTTDCIQVSLHCCGFPFLNMFCRYI